MWLVVFLGIMALLSSVFGIRGFFAGLLSAIGTMLYYAWKGLEVLDFIRGVLEFLHAIFQLLSLFG